MPKVCRACYSMQSMPRAFAVRRHTKVSTGRSVSPLPRATMRGSSARCAARTCRARSTVVDDWQASLLLVRHPVRGANRAAKSVTPHVSGRCGWGHMAVGQTIPAQAERPARLFAVHARGDGEQPMLAHFAICNLFFFQNEHGFSFSFFF